MNRIGERAIKFFKFTPIIILISCIFFTTALHTQEAHADTGKKAELEKWISTVKGNNKSEAKRS